MKFSVFHTVFGVTFWGNFLSDTQTLENIAHQNFTPNFTTPFAEKNGENVHSALLQGSCSEGSQDQNFRVPKCSL